MKKFNSEEWPKVIAIWIDRAVYDIETADAMLETGRYLYVIFMCQQAIEKVLKAILSLQDKDVIPIHNLAKLAKTAGILDQMEEEDKVGMDDLSAFYLNARYRDTIETLSKSIGEKEAEKTIRWTKEFMEWLILKMKQFK